MTLNEIDHALAHWQAQLARVDENLLALTNDADFKLVVANASRFSGRTAERLAKSQEATRIFSDLREKIDGVLTRAGRLRSEMSRLWPSDQRLREIGDLLQGPAVVRVLGHIPIAQRGLLSSGDNTASLTMDDALATMEREFAVMRAASADVTSAWLRLAAARQVTQQKLDILEAVASTLDVGEHLELEALRSELTAFRAQIDTDPLEAVDRLAAIQPRLSEINRRLAALADLRALVLADQTHARDALANLQPVHQNAFERYAPCRPGIAPAGAVQASVPEEGVTDGSRC